jgi:hypothetical protein
MRRFLLKTALYVILVLGMFELLFRAGFRPIITDSVYFDLKMGWIQRHPLKNPELILIGSSVPLYGIESAQLVQQLPVSYFNFCSWRVRMADCRMVVKPLVRDYRPKYVMVGSGIGDFCNETDYTYLNYTTASPFIRHYLPELFYLLDFHSIHQIAYRKLKSRKVRFDQWGGGDWAFDRSPLNGPLADLGQVPEQLPFDPQNEHLHYQALDSMSRWLRDQQVKMIFVQFPVSSASMKVDSIRARVERHIRICQTMVEANGGVFLNYIDSLRGRDSLFAGPEHLIPDGAKLFTGILVRDLRKIIGQTP